MLDNSSKLVNKTRHLSVYQLFEILQEEFIICELRSKIYPLESHKVYWKNTAESKKTKIIDIAKRNQLSTIFDNSKIKESLEKKVIPERGMPLFFYRDEAHKQNQSKWDWINYFAPRSDVKIYENGYNVGVGVIKEADIETDEIKVVLNGNVETYTSENIVRIL